MKPLHLAVAAAVVLVAALVALMAISTGERGGSRRSEGREAGTPVGDTAGAIEVDRAAAGGTSAGAGALSITLRIVDPDDAPAGGAEVEMDRGLDALRAAADADGVLRVRGLDAGIYDLRARKGPLAGALRFELARSRDLGTLRLSASIAIRGRVFGPRGEPLPGATVEALRAVERQGFDIMSAVQGMVEPEEVVARARTADDGAYELRLPAGGTHSLRATAKGFAQEGEAPRRYGSDTEGVDFHLTPGALLEGRVLDPQQSPVAGARILILDAMSVFGHRMPKAESVSGADGSFSLVAAPTQQSMLVVRAAGYATHMQPNLRIPQENLVITLEEGVTLRLQAVDGERPEIPAPRVNVVAAYKGGFAAGVTDDEGRLVLQNLATRGGGMGNQREMFLWGGGYVAQRVELRMEPVDGMVDAGIVKLEPGGTVRGRVLDKSTGDPIAGARVRTFGGLDAQLEFVGMTSAVSAKDGSFTLGGVPLGAHTILANHPDFVSEVDPMSLMAGMRGGSGGPPLFAEGQRDVQKDVELLPAEVVAGVVLSPDGTPVAGATVAVNDDDGMSFVSIVLGGGPASATTDAEGRFVLKGLRPGGETTISATHRDYGASEEVRARAGDAGTILRLAAPLTVRGIVVDEAGTPVASVRVQVARTERRGPRAPLDSGPVRPSITDGEGRYLVRNAPPGELTVAFDHPDYAPVSTAITLTAAHDLGRTVLPRGGSIAGTAVNADGAPVPGVPIYANREGSPAQATGRSSGNAVTDEKGAFTFRGLDEGEYRLRTFDRDYYSAGTLARTGTTDARVVLGAAGRLVGRVTGRGLPVAGANVRAMRGPGEFLGWARTGPDGSFVMAPLPPDEPFRVVIEHDAYRQLAVDAVSAAERTQDFVLETGASVGGRVVDDRGRGVREASVSVRVNARHVKSVQTDAAGAFTAGGLDDGQISVRLEESNQGFVPTDWLEVEAQGRDVRLVATTGESIRGSVRDREGKPLHQVRLEALDADGRVASSAWLWDESGAFELRGLRPGTYTVRATRFVSGQQPVMREVAGVATGTKGTDLRFDE
jgi:protocatechuate 3,4-dioxygenase beta subunit